MNLNLVISGSYTYAVANKLQFTDIWYNCREIVQTLVNAGADIDALDKFKRRPEDLAKEMGQKEIMNYLKSIRKNK